MKLKTIAPYVVLLCSIILCTLPSSPCYGEKLPVAASIFPIADMVKQVGKDHVKVTTIIPPGASPHTFALKPSQVKEISAARVLFVIGAGLESWTEKIVTSAQHPNRKVVLSEDVILIHGIRQHHPHEGSLDDEEGSANPHIWLDPVIAETMVDRIVEALGQIDHANKDDYRTNGDAYKQDLRDLDDTIKNTIAEFRIKTYVSLHSAWAYFARRYGLESVGTVEASPGRHPTPKTILKIIRQISKHSITAVFAEPQLNPRIAEVIARQVNARVLILDPIGGPDLEGRDTYIGLMEYNLRVFQEAMK